MGQLQEYEAGVHHAIGLLFYLKEGSDSSGFEDFC